MAVTTVQHNFTVADNATKHLTVIHKAAEKVSEAFDHASHIAGMFGTVAAIAGSAFSAHEIINGTLEYLGNVKKIHDLTGETAATADAYLDVMKGVGISGEESVGIIGQMSRQGQRMEMAMQGTAGAVGGVRGLFQRLNIDMKGGPVKTFDQLALRAKQHKLNVQDLAIAYRMPIESARKFMLALQQGPGAVAKIKEELAKKGIGVTSDDLETYKRIQAVTNEIKKLWERLTIVIGKNFLPIIEPLMAGVRDHMEEWVSKAAQFAKTMGHFIKEHGPMLLKIVKLMALNFTLMKATGMGIGGLFGKAVGAFSPGAPIGGMLFKAIKSIIGPLVASMGGPVAGVIGSIGAALGPVLLAVAAIAAVAALIYAAFTMIRDNVYGMRDTVLEIWDKLKARVEVIVDLVSDMFKGGSPLGDFFQMVLPMAFQLMGDAMDGVLHVIQTIILVIGKMQEDFVEAIRHPIKVFQDAWDEANRRTAKKQVEHLEREATRRTEERKRARTEAADKRESAPHYDFRGSRFDITQKFAEGFDPDRIAVAFASDLSSLGERRLQSSFTPVGAVR